MKIILLKEVEKLGHAGDIKEVSGGYARNFLIPQGLAKAASSQNIKLLKENGIKQVKNKKLDVKNKKGLAKKIDGRKFTIKAKADEKGTLYAGLDSKAIAKELSKHKFNIAADEVVLKEKIKKLGCHDVRLSLGGQKAKIKIEVISQ